MTLLRPVFRGAPIPESHRGPNRRAAFTNRPLSASGETPIGAVPLQFRKDQGAVGAAEPETIGQDVFQLGRLRFLRDKIQF